MASQKANRSIALSLLMASIHIAAEAGNVVPCLDRRRSHLWISDDPEQQEAAAHGCTTCCPALVACRSYVSQHPEPAGVWAGRRHGQARLLPEGHR